MLLIFGSPPTFNVSTVKSLPSKSKLLYEAISFVVVKKKSGTRNPSYTMSYAVSFHPQNVLRL